MTIDITDQLRRIVYFGNDTTGPFSFPFEIINDTDLGVYVNDTLLTITSDYTVTINPDGTGEITLVIGGTLSVEPTSTDSIGIFGNKGIQRQTDFTTGGDLFANSLNDEFDAQTIFAQQNSEAIQRSLRAPITDPTDIDMLLPSKTDRKGTVLGFNATTGNPEIGPTIADVSSLADITADIATLADIEDGTDATDAIQTVAGISSNVTTVAGISSNVTTVAGNNSNVTTCATNIAAINAAPTEAANAAASATAAAASETAAAASESAAAASETAAAASETAAAASETAAASSASSASTSASTATTKASEASTSATNAATSESNAASSASSASTSASTATTQASNASTSATNAATSETNAASSATAAASSATAAASSATAAASSATAAGTSETNAATSETNAATSATNAATSETNAATSATSASTSATNAASSATSAATSATNAATSETNASSSASSASSAQTAAESARDAALAALDDFDDRYLGQKTSDPTVDNDGNALVAGALYFNTTDDVMKVYEGSTWVAAYASLSGALLVANNLSDLADAASARTNLGVSIGTDVQAYSSVLANTTASYTTAEETKLAGIETGATADQTAQEIATAIDADATAEATLKSALGLGTAAYTSSGDYVATTGDTMTGYLSFGDNDRVRFGNSFDLQIYHSGSGSYINDIGTGSLYIQGSSLYINDSSGNNFIACADTGTGGTVYLKHNTNTVLNTAATGVDITGDLTVSGGDITLSGTGRIQGIDTVSASTDAASKGYVDTAVASAGGGSTFEATASGAITAGDPCVLNSDGTVSSVSGTYNDNVASLEAAIGTYTSDYYFSAFGIDQANNKALLVYPTTGNNTGMVARVVTLNSDNTMTFGASEYSLGSGADNGAYQDVISLGSNRYLFIATVSGVFYAWCMTVSGTAVTIGTRKTIDSSSGYFSSVCYNATNDRAYTMHYDGSPYTTIYYNVLSFSGTTITSTANATVTTGATAFYGFHVHDEVNDRILFCYQKLGNQQCTYGTLGTSSISLGSEQNLGVSRGDGYANGNKQNNYGWSTDNSKWVFNISGADGYCYLVTADYDGSNGANRLLRGNDCIGWWDNSTNSHTVIYDGGVTMEFQKFTLESDNSWTPTLVFKAEEINPNIIPAQENGGTYGNRSFLKFWETNSVAIWHRASFSPNAVYLAIGDLGTSNLTATNYIGVAESTVADTATATIQLGGVVDTNQSGLTVGTAYYCDPDGTVSSYTDKASILAAKMGIATATTDLLLKDPLA